MQKKKISPFEYAIIQCMAQYDPEAAKDLENVEPYTEEEIMRQREDNIRRQMQNIKIKNS